MRFHVDLQGSAGVAGHDELDNAVGAAALGGSVLRQPEQPRLAVGEGVERLADDDGLGRLATHPALDRAIGMDDARRARDGPRWGVVYRPEGKGPFPAVVYNHGSAAGMVSKSGFEALGPVFASHGWVFFGPYRRGQGLSASAGPYIGDQIGQPKKSGGIQAAADTMVRLLKTDHLNDQLAALAWLRKQGFVQA